MSIDRNNNSGRGVILTAAATLVFAAAIVLYFVTGIGSDEVSRAEYRQGLTVKLTDDDRLGIPSAFGDEQAEEYISCLTGTYEQVTDRARRIVTSANSLTTLHSKDFETIIFEAADCKEAIAAEQQQD